MRLSIGDQVTTPNGAQAILRWTGRIDGKPIEYAGVELLKGTGLHSGEHNGVKYFEVERPNAGIFVSYSKLVSANVVTPLSRLGETRMPQRETSSDKARLEALLEERELKIKELKHQMEERRVEFRQHLASIEADRNQMAEHYEGILREFSGGDELEGQRAALAAMQNSLMEENAQIKEQLEAERAKKTAAVPPDLEGVLSQLTAQQELMTAMEADVQELDSLRTENEQLKATNEVLEAQCAEMEASLNEVASLKDSLEELSLGPVPDAALKREIDELKQKSKQDAEVIAELKKQVETAEAKAAKAESQAKASAAAPAAPTGGVSAETEKQIVDLTAAVAAQKRRADKATADAQMAQKDAQMYFKMSDPDAFEANKARIKELEKQVQKLLDAQEKLEATSPAPSAAPAAANGPPSAPPPTAPAKTKAPVPSATAEPASADLERAERELEDQILREAGLLEDTAVAGREQWCGLCERSGHTSVDCPYE